MKISERIRYLRQKRQWTQTELGKRIGVLQKQVSAYERGVHMPSSEKLIELADVFGVTIDSLCMEAHGSPRPFSIRDRELLALFEELDDLPECERELAKDMLDLVLLKHRFRNLMSEQPVRVSAR